MSLKIPYGDDGANLLAPGLYIGSRPDGLDFAKEKIDAVVLCETEYQPESIPGVTIIRAPIEDRGLTPGEFHVAELAAAEAVVRWEFGNRVLVACYGGRNRSGLVAALILLRSRYLRNPLHAIEAVRKARGASAMVAAFGPALSNEFFVRYLVGGDG